MKYIFSFIIFFLIFINVSGQYTVVDVNKSQRDDQPSHTLSKNEILLICLVPNGFLIKVSIDKTNWKNKFIRNEDAIEISLDDEYAYFYVRVCNSNAQQIDCINYRLKPGKRYGLQINQDSGNIIIKSGGN